MKNILKNNKIRLAIFTIACLIAIAVCAICDLAITQSFSWSLIPITSIIYSWLVLLPAILQVNKWIYKSLAILSVLIIPFLYLLSIFLKTEEIFSIATITSIIGIIYLWCVAGIWHRFSKQKYLAAGLTVLLATPVSLAINLILSKMLFQPLLDPWDIFSICLLLIISAILFTANYSKHHKGAL